MLNIRHIISAQNRQSSYSFLARYRGELLGSGIYRDVYSITGSNQYVLKICNKPGDFSNVTEWEVFNFVNATPHHRLLAPCFSISPDAQFLIMGRTFPIKDVKDLPSRVPAWMTDLKPQNWGRRGDKVVCHDYATNLVLNQCVLSATKPARWHD